MADYAPYLPSEKAQLLSVRLRVEELEHILRHFDGASMHLLHYVRAIEGLPTREQWQLIRDQIDEMVAADGPRNFNGRS